MKKRTKKNKIQTNKTLVRSVWSYPQPYRDYPRKGEAKRKGINEFSSTIAGHKWAGFSF